MLSQLDAVVRKGFASDSSDDADDSDTGVRMVNDDLGTDFGASRSSHSNRKVRKVKKVKRPRKSL